MKKKKNQNMLSLAYSLQNQKLKNMFNKPQSGLPISYYQWLPKGGAESVLLHINSNILLQRALSTPSFGHY